MTDNQGPEDALEPATDSQFGVATLSGGASDVTSKARAYKPWHKADLEADPDADLEADLEADSDSDLDADPDAEASTAHRTEPGYGSQYRDELGYGSEYEDEPDAEPDPGPEPDPQTAPEAADVRMRAVPSDFAAKVQVLAGVVVAAFAGALYFIGLRGGELSAVIRNQAQYSTLVLGLIVAAILTAIASIFVAPAWRVSTPAWVATAGALIVPASLTIALIRTSPTSSTAERIAAWSLAGLGAIVAVVGSFAVLSDRPRRPAFRTRVPAQGLLIFVAITLTATATYATVRLETVSQTNSTAAQLTPTITERDGLASLVLGLDAQRLAQADRVNVKVWGLERSVKTATFCSELKVARVGNLSCVEAPCYFAEYAGNTSAPQGCDDLSSGIYQPDDVGSIHQSITMPVKNSLYQRVEMLGQICTLRNLASAATCTYRANTPITRIDMQIPTT